MMERDDIIKALECCKSFRDFYMCDICPYYRLELADDENCTNRLSQDALSLIKELTEENERLKAEKIAALDTFAEKLKRYYNALNGRTPAVLVAYHIDQIKEEMLRSDSDANT